MRSSDFLNAMRPVTLNDQTLFGEYFRRNPPRICEHSFTNMLLWADVRKVLFREWKDHLVVSFQKKGKPRQWYQPIGPDPSRIIAELSTDGDFWWMDVEESVASLLPEAFATFVHLERDRFDYVYAASALRTLSGTKYEAKRNYIKRCEKYNPTVTVLDASSGPACLALHQRWVERQEDPTDIGIEAETAALAGAFEHFDRLRMFGIGVHISGALEAFALGTPLNEHTIDQLFEKSSNQYKGLYQYVFHQFVLRLPQTYTWINKEEDCGLPGLREAKEGWQPQTMVRKCSIVPVNPK